MHASKVGVHTVNAEYTQGARHVPCARCGVVRIANGSRQVMEICRDCRSTDPTWGTVPFDDLPTSASNVCAFDEPYVSLAVERKRAARQRTREAQ